MRRAVCFATAVFLAACLNAEPVALDTQDISLLRRDVELLVKDYTHVLDRMNLRLAYLEEKVAELEAEQNSLKQEFCALQAEDYEPVGGELVEAEQDSADTVHSLAGLIAELKVQGQAILKRLEELMEKAQKQAGSQETQVAEEQYEETREAFEGAGVVESSGEEGQGQVQQETGENPCESELTESGNVSESTGEAQESDAPRYESSWWESEESMEEGEEAPCAEANEEENYYDYQSAAEEEWEYEGTGDREEAEPSEEWQEQSGEEDYYQYDAPEAWYGEEQDTTQSGLSPSDERAEYDGQAEYDESWESETPSHEPDFEGVDQETYDEEYWEEEDSESQNWESGSCEGEERYESEYMDRNSEEPQAPQPEETQQEESGCSDQAPEGPCMDPLSVSPPPLAMPVAR